ncbi:MAG: CAP domain-containing protein [Ectobacillus sp.]
MSAQYLQPTAHVAGHKGTVTASLLNVRSMPSINGKIIGGLKKGTAVSISKRLSNGWLQISYNGKAAYVFGKYVTPAAETAAAPVPNASVAVLSAYEQKVVELTNAERIKNGLAALQVDTALSRVARMKSEDMLKNRYFSHNSPTYGSPFNMMRANGITYRSAGENIAMGQRTPEEVVKAWMDSPGHRANILNNTFTHIGVGYVPEQNIWTQQFIGK